MSSNPSGRAGSRLRRSSGEQPGTQYPHQRLLGSIVRLPSRGVGPMGTGRLIQPGERARTLTPSPNPSVNSAFPDVRHAFRDDIDVVEAKRSTPVGLPGLDPPLELSRRRPEIVPVQGRHVFARGGRPLLREEPIEAPILVRQSRRTLSSDARPQTPEQALVFRPWSSPRSPRPRTGTGVVCCSMTLASALRCTARGLLRGHDHRDQRSFRGRPTVPRRRARRPRRRLARSARSTTADLVDVAGGDGRAGRQLKDSLDECRGPGQTIAGLRLFDGIGRHPVAAG